MDMCKDFFPSIHIIIACSTSIVLVFCRIFLGKCYQQRFFPDKGYKTIWLWWKTMHIDGNEARRCQVTAGQTWIKLERDPHKWYASDDKWDRVKWWIKLLLSKFFPVVLVTFLMTGILLTGPSAAAFELIKHMMNWLNDQMFSVFHTYMYSQSSPWDHSETCLSCHSSSVIN